MPSRCRARSFRAFSRKGLQRRSSRAKARSERPRISLRAEQSALGWSRVGIRLATANFLQLRPVCLRFRASGKVRENEEKLFAVYRLGHVHVEAREKRSSAIFHPRVSRQSNGRNGSASFAREGSDSLDEGVAVLDWHSDVRNDDVRLPFGESLETLGRRAHGSNGDLALLEENDE